MNPPGKTPPEGSSPYASAAAVPSAYSAFNVELSVLQEIFPVYLFILLNRTMPKFARAQRTPLLYLSSISDGTEQKPHPSKDPRETLRFVMTALHREV